MRSDARKMCGLALLLLPSLLGMTVKRQAQLRNDVRALFDHGFDSYMTFAFPEDELQPLKCTGRGRDRQDNSNLGINDVCGDYALTLIDTLDALPILGHQDAFEGAVRNVIDTVTFDLDSSVQVFEVTIRILGGLLSAHQYASLPELNSTISWYNGELLDLAYDLGQRLLPAFDSPTRIPYPRINLKYGIHGLFSGATKETCSAGAGSLVLEFFLLSRLTNDMRFHVAAKQAFQAIWDRRMELGLVGNTLSAETGAWTSSYTGIGAGIDSFYEYALKMWVFTGDDYFHDVWLESSQAIQKHIIDDEGLLLKHVHLRTGFLLANYIDSLSAYYPGLLVLAGDLEQATKSYLVYQSLWTRFKALPERYNYNTLQVDIPWYPLRPEFIESTYFLYRATKDPFYLAVGQQVLRDLTALKQNCGFAVVADVTKKTYDDRMESFMLSETLKYLYLLFDEDHPLHRLHSNWVFTTEGHPIFLTDVVQSRSNRTSQALTGSIQCQVPDKPGFFSKVMSRNDLSYAQYRAGLMAEGSGLPAYFPPAHPQSQSKVVRKRAEIEVLFGAVASTVANASAHFVQIGKDLVVKSLLGLKIAFERQGDAFKATKIGDFTLSNDTEVVIEDPLYQNYITQDLVNFSSEQYDTQLGVLSLDDNLHVVEAMAAIYGTPLPPIDSQFGIYSMLNTTNSEGCICPAVYDSEQRQHVPQTTALLVARGGCTFYEKSLNARGQARVIVVVDSQGTHPSYIRPSLTGPDDLPMPSDEQYPSLLLVEGVKSTILLQNARRLVLQGKDRSQSKIKLVIRGEEVTNIEVSIA